MVEIERNCKSLTSALIFTLFCIVLTIIACTDLAKYSRIRKWVAVSANITRTHDQVTEVADAKGEAPRKIYKCFANYTYVVASNMYRGWRMSPQNDWGHKETCDKIRKNINDTLCYYNPSKVSESFLFIRYSPVLAAGLLLGSFVCAQFALIVLCLGIDPEKWQEKGLNVGITSFASVYAAVCFSIIVWLIASNRQSRGSSMYVSIAFCALFAIAIIVCTGCTFRVCARTDKKDKATLPSFE